MAMDTVRPTQIRRAAAKITVAAASSAVALAAFGGAVSADPADCEFSNVAAVDPECSTDVQPVGLDPDLVTDVAAPAGNPTPAQTSPQLPVTGGDAGTLAVAGAAMLGGGMLMVSRSRKTADVES